MAELGFVVGGSRRSENDEINVSNCTSESGGGGRQVGAVAEGVRRDGGVIAHVSNVSDDGVQVSDDCVPQGFQRMPSPLVSRSQSALDTGFTLPGSTVTTGNAEINVSDCTSDSEGGGRQTVAVAKGVSRGGGVIAHMSNVRDDGVQVSDAFPSVLCRANSFIHPPSPDVKAGVPRALRNLRTELFHFFLSYRVSSEGPIIESLYDSILRLSSGEKKIPQGAKGEWPRFARVPQAPDSRKHTVKGFLDKRCLVDGKDWEAGFILGLMHSLVFVPIISAFKINLTDQDSKEYKGSVGDMIDLNHTDKVDNVLLEYIVAWHWSRKEGTYLQSIYPIMVGEKLSDGTYAKFDFSLLDKLPQKPSHKTNERAALILKMLGFEDEQIKEMKQRTVKQIVEMMFKYQGHKADLSDTATNGNVQDCWAHKILDVIIRDIRSLQHSPSEFAFKRPGGHEVLQWLCERNLLKLSRIFAEHDVDSLLKISKMTDVDIHVMFRPDGVAGVAPISKLTQGMLSTLRGAIEELRKSKMANKYSKRLFEYRDSKTALGTAVWTSNSAEIACGKWQVQFVLICLAGFFLNTAYDNLNGKMTMWRTKDYGVVLWVKCVWYIPFWITNVIVFLKAAYEGRYKAPCTARITLEEHNGRWNILLIMGVIAEIAQILLNQHEPGWTLHKTFSSGGIISEILLYLPACLITWWSIRYRPELWIPCWLGLATIVGIVFSYTWRANAINFACVLLITLLLGFAFVYFLLSNVFTIRNAKKKNRRRAQRFSEEWQKILMVNNVNEGQVPLEKVVTNGPLKDLVELTDSVQEELKTQYLAFRSHLSLLRRQTQSRTKGYGRFAVHERKNSFGKFRQSTSDFDRLFEQASSLNSAVHDFLWDLISPLQEAATEHGRKGSIVGSLSHRTSNFERFPCLLFGPIKKPDRAIQKCVRSYRRDVGCLTDLVRCTIVVETTEQLLRVFKMFRDKSIIGIESVERSYLLGVDVEDDDANSRQSLSSLQSDNDSGDLQEDIYFRITQVKNRFHHKSEYYDPGTGYRDLSLNLEVGWNYDFDILTFLPVQEWSKGVTEQHIIEVQIHMLSMYRISNQLGVHEGYIEWRDLMSK